MTRYAAAMRTEREVNSAVAAWTSELNKERAGALGMTARKLEDLLAECATLGPQIDAAKADDLRALLLADYRRLWAEAEDQRWKMCVQREAMGLFRHDDVDRIYPRPPRR